MSQSVGHLLHLVEDGSLELDKVRLGYGLVLRCRAVDLGGRDGLGGEGSAARVGCHVTPCDDVSQLVQR